MSAVHEIEDERPRLRIVTEETGNYDTDDRQPTPGEAAGGSRHVRIPFAIFSCPYLSHGAIVLYGWLQQHCGEKGCFPSYETLAGEMRAGERSVMRYRQELEDAGVLERKRGGGASSNHYALRPGGLRPIPAKMADIGARAPKWRVERRQNGGSKDAKMAQESNPVNQTQLIKDSAPTERAAPEPKPTAKVAAAPKEPTPTIGAKPAGPEHVPPSKRARDKAPPPSGDGFGLVGWLLKEQGGIARAEYLKVADARNADAVIARLGGVEAAQKHATARLLEPRRTTLLWSHILEDLQRAAAARQRGVLERRPPRQMVSAADGFGAVARRERGEEDDDQGRNGRTAATTFDGVARPL